MGPLEPLEPLDLGTVRTFAPWKILVTLSLASMAALCAHAKVAGAAHGAVEETVDLGTWSDSIEGCRSLKRYMILWFDKWLVSIVFFRPSF